MTRLPSPPAVLSRRPFPAALPPVLASLAVLGCGILWGGAGEERVVGHIDFSDDAVRMPATATAGVPVELAIWTNGGGCHRGGDTEVVVRGRTVIVTPYDFVDRTAQVCTLILMSFDHGVSVVFAEPGTARVELRYTKDFGPQGPRHNAVRVFTVEVSSAGPTSHP